MERPNLFNYATKELSQDAMICWLIEWSGNKADDGLHELGRTFVEALLNHKREGNRIVLSPCPKLQINQQDNYIDVLVRVDDRYVLLVEDKTGTYPHSDQLARYRDMVVGGKTRLGNVDGLEIFPIYLKTGNQSIAADKEVELGGYKVFSRTDFLSVLSSYAGSNTTALDYRAYLQSWEDRTQSFWHWREVDQCADWHAWHGLYRALEHQLFQTDGEAWHGWGYVPNRAGGFLGFWWQPTGVAGGIRPYIQIEEERLCFRVKAADCDSQERQNLKWNWHERFMALGHGRLSKPAHMRVGASMAVAEWNDDWISYKKNGKFDLVGTVETLREAERVLVGVTTGHCENE